MLPPSDPVALARTLRSLHDDGRITTPDYLVAHRALDAAATEEARSRQCEYEWHDKRCKMQALIWHDGRVYCAHHGAQARRGLL